MLTKFTLHLTLFIVLCATLSQAALAQDCAPPKVTVNAKTYNIFSPEQEMILGDLTYQSMLRDMRFVRDPQLLAYVNRIGDKLVQHLPPTGLKFQFYIIDLPEANAFNIPGGHVFISRKLIAFARNEDELAGVMAHELGHAVMRHAANDFSILFKEILGVTQVSDRKDITDKYNLLLERERTKYVGRVRNHESQDQQEADRIGLFAATAAGYDPTMFATFFDRLVDNNGKTGNWFTDIFGKSKPEQARIRAMIKLIEQLPAQCRERHQTGTSPEFLNWQADVISFRESNRKEELPGLVWKKALTPKLRSDISHITFSADGAYLLAQDDFAITVMQREPLKVLFQIPANDARPATFTPDNKFVVFETENMRYEKWSIQSGKSVQIRELVVTSDCWEHALSPDGQYLVCVDYEAKVNVLETRTGQKVWEKKDFYRLDYFEYWFWLYARANDKGDEPQRLFNIEFSPDSRIIAISRSNKFRYNTDFYGYREEDLDTLLALDLSTMTPIKTGGELKKATKRPFIFLDSNRIVAMPSRKVEDSGIFSFPDGKRLAKFPLAGNELRRTGNPNYIVVKPLANAKLGVYDISKSALVIAFNKEDIAFSNDTAAYESINGKLILTPTHYDETAKILKQGESKSVEIPVSPINALATAELSDNFQWLALSSRSRGALWNLNSGEQKMFLRGFRGAVLANNGEAIGDFPKLEEMNHSLVLLNPANNNIMPIREIPEKGASQYRLSLLVRSSLKQPKKVESKKPDGRPNQSEEEEAEAGFDREVRFEVRDVLQDKSIWSREFPKGAPRYFFDELSGRLVLYWTLGSDEGKARLKEDAALAERSRLLGNKTDDYLLEVIDAYAGKTIGTLLLETGKGSFDIKSGFSTRDWLVLYDPANRVLVYSLKDGQLHHRFFGANAAMNPATDQIVVENYPGELTFYDLRSGESQARLVLNSGAAFVRFSHDGKNFFVLSEEQAAYAIKVDNLAAAAKSSSAKQ